MWVFLLDKKTTNVHTQELKKVQRELRYTKKNNENTFKVKSIKSEIRLKTDIHDEHGKQ